MEPAAPANTQALPPGTRLEEFEIERVLGSGGFGITYLATDTSLNRQVVIKENLPAQFAWRDSHSLTVAPRHTTGEDADNFVWSLENFAKEAAMLASLDHPGIVKVLMNFKALGTAFFVMPYVDGQAFDELIGSRADKGKPFDADEIKGFLEHLLGALDYLHGRGIYHRDIKPGNILVNREGIPVLIDFGSARQHLSERSMTIVESPGYTPFEQLQSRGNIGPWSDLYALAATSCRAITGETLPKATDRAFDDPWVPLTQRPEISARLPRTLLASIDKALQPRTQDRWQNSRDWLAALEGNASSEIPPDPQPGGTNGVGTAGSPTTKKPKAQKLSAIRKVATRIVATAVIIGCLAGAAYAWTELQRHLADNREAALQVREAERIAQLEIEQARRLEQQEREAAIAEDRRQQMLLREAELEAERKAAMEKQAIVDAERRVIMHREVLANAPEFVRIAAGEFKMGNASGDSDAWISDNAPPVTVYVGEFHIATHLVTWGLWNSVRSWAENNGYNDIGVGAGKATNHPVYSISWWDAVKWCNARSEKEDLMPVYQNPDGSVFKNGMSAPVADWEANGYRLPTEAEWEKAARGGIAGKRFPLGNVIQHDDANFHNSGDEAYASGSIGYHPKYSTGGRPFTSPVGSFQPNDHGLYDMAGNLWTWCWDWFADGSYTEGARNPKGPNSGTEKALRGGSWLFPAGSCRVANRSSNIPALRNEHTGFRPARGLGTRDR